MPLGLILVALAAHTTPVAAQADTLRGRSPAIFLDGRMVVSVRGDLWMIPGGLNGGPGEQITEGPAWDDDPVWTPDGRAVVFTSDRAGAAQIFRVEPGGGVAQLTHGHIASGEPSVRPDGSIVFVRGTDAAADLWELSAGGKQRQLTRRPGAEREPAVSPDGERIAYVSVVDGRRSLRLGGPGDTDRVLAAGHAAADPAWSPDGRHLVFSTSGQSQGVWMTPADGSWVVPVSLEAGKPVWDAGGEWVVVADADPDEPAYNGDPTRPGRRRGGDAFREEPVLSVVRAPHPPDRERRAISSDAGPSREALNAAAFDRVFDRVAELYFADGSGWAGRSLDRWRAAGEKHRPRALAATDDPALEMAIHELLRERPLLEAPADGRAAVSSGHPLATAAGVEILEAGGNVVDAAVAISFALGVVEPDASGIGGYGEMLIHIEGMSEPVAIEFMTRLPEAYGESPAPDNEEDGHGALLTNVPGTVAGMYLAWQRHGGGRLEWARLLEPAIRIAENGFVLDDAFATTLAREREAFERHEGSRALFFRNGRPLERGDTLRNPDLAWTLRQIADKGADAFYRGEIATRMVSDLRAHGNPIAGDDLQRYFAAERRPVRTTYRGHAVYGGAPPVTGGALLAGKLNLLERAPPGTSMTDDVAKLHAMLEAWKLQPSTQGRIADPDLWPTDVTPFESKDTAAGRWRCFDPGRASVRNAVSNGCDASDRDAEGPIPSARSTGTTAFAVADADGNAVAVTQTLGTWGGNFHITPGLGFLYNDKFNSYRDDPDAYGTRLPYARNTTVIAPTIIYDGVGSAKRPLMALGAAGNAWITAAVYAMVVGVLDHGLSPQQAIELPRMLPGGGAVQIEDGFAPDAISKLEEMGHEFRRISRKGELRMGYAAAVMLRDGSVTAAADPRRSGAAGAVGR